MHARSECRPVSASGFNRCGAHLAKRGSQERAEAALPSGPADLAQEIVRHPAAPGEVPPHATVLVRRSAVHIDDRATAKATEHFACEPWRCPDIGASRHEDMSACVR